VYIFLIRITYFVGTHFFSSAYHIIFFGILSYAFFKSINIICRSFFCCRHLSMSCFIKKILFIVDLPDIKLNWFLKTVVSFIKQRSITLLKFHSMTPELNSSVISTTLKNKNINLKQKNQLTIIIKSMSMMVPL
jgi:hypothetical protein